MAWKIMKVDNGKKQYEIHRHTGEVLKVAVPEEHRDQVLSHAYVNAVCAAHDSVLDKGGEIARVAVSAPVKGLFIKAAVSVIAAAAALLFPVCLPFALPAIMGAEFLNFLILLRKSKK
jgi:hypothetical protein